LSEQNLHIHLDTTLQIERLKTDELATAVDKGLHDFKFRSTSTYAKHEFNRTLIRDLAFLYTHAQRASGFGDIVGQIKNSFGSKLASKNRLTRCLEIIQRFLDQRPKTLTVDLEMVRLREHLAFMLANAHMVWQRSVHHEFQGTACHRAEIKPRLAPNEKIIFSLPQCRRNNIKCKIHEFFQANLASFEKIASKAEALGEAASKQLAGAAKQIREASKDPPILCDDRKCAKIGDAIIAVDGIDLPWFGANNDEDWQPISEALGKELLNPVRGKGNTSSSTDAEPK